MQKNRGGGGNYHRGDRRTHQTRYNRDNNNNNNNQSSSSREAPQVRENWNREESQNTRNLVDNNNNNNNTPPPTIDINNNNSPLAFNREEESSLDDELRREAKKEKFQMNTGLGRIRQELPDMPVSEKKIARPDRRKRILENEITGLAAKPAFIPRNPKLSTKCTLYANHFTLLTEENASHSQYAVTYEPQCEARLSRLLFSKLENELPDFIINHVVLFTVRPLDVPPDGLVFSVTHKTTTYKITIRNLKDINRGPINSTVSLHLWNLIRHKVLLLMGLKVMGRAHFDSKSPISLPKHNVQLWPGYFTSVGTSMNSISLIVDTSYKVIRTDTVLDLIRDNQNKPNARSAIENALVGTIVLTRYNNKTYRIDSVEWGMNPQSTFERGRGEILETISFARYMLDQYDKKISTNEQPLLCHKMKDHSVFLIPEFCYQTGISNKMRSDFRVMRDLAQTTSLTPEARQKEILNFVKEMTAKPEVVELLKNWNLTPDNRLMELEGYTFRPESISSGSKSVTLDRSEWQSLFKDSRVLKASPINSWVLIYSKRDQNFAYELEKGLARVSGPMGLSLSNPVHISLTRDTGRDFANAIDKTYSPQNTSLFVCLLPNNNKDRYNEVKMACTVRLGVPSQVVVASTLKKNLFSVCTKIALQINSKMGGEAWKIDIPMKNVMVVGVDVCHDNQRGGRNSVAGYCATTNHDLTQYFSQISIQPQSQEICYKFGEFLTNALVNYLKINKTLPACIFVYRDGVGEGHLAEVKDSEINQMKAVFQQIEQMHQVKYDPRVSFIVVTKRIHTRMFQKTQRGIANPTPGTVLDYGCTTKDWYDFFLVSQNSGIGTVTPTHYHVLADNSGLSSELLQLFTYKLCHLYANWSATIRVPAPCQYAHKIAFVVGQSLHTAPHAQLENKLHYL